MTRWSLAALAAVTLAACTPSPEQEAARIRAASDSARTAIEAQTARFVRGAAAGNTDSMVAVYTENAVVMPPGAPAVSNRDSLKAMFATFGPFTIAFTIVSVWADGGVATEHGTFEYTLTPPGGPPATTRGKYLARWERWETVPGQWVMTHDIWNDDAPMPPAPPPAPTRR